MSGSFITYDDVYLVLKPISPDIYMVLFSVFLILLLYLSYQRYKTQITKFNYILISLFIVINSCFLTMFLTRMSQEIKRFANLTYRETLTEILPGDFDGFYTLIDNKISRAEMFSFNDPDDPFYDNVRTKFQLAYYLLPRVIASNPSEADYAIVANYLFNPDIKVVIPKNKVPDMFPYSPELTLIRFNDKQADTEPEKEPE